MNYSAVAFITENMKEKKKGKEKNPTLDIMKNQADKLLSFAGHHMWSY